MFLKFLRNKTKGGCGDGLPEEGIPLGIDPDMYYCPSCSGEFRLNVPYCPVCRMKLVSGADKLAQEALGKERHCQRSMVLEPGVALVTIRKGPLQEMKYLQKVLERGYIPGLISGDEGGCGKGCCGPEMYLQIRKEDVDPALEILAKDFVRSTSLDCHDLSHASAVFDPSADETHCPACGCRFPPSVGACPDCGLCFL
jgi:hypothetical protein